MRPTISLKSTGKLAELMQQNAQALEDECYVVIARSLYYVNHGARVVSGALREEYEAVGMEFSSLRPRMRAEIEQLIFPAARQPQPQTSQTSQRQTDQLPTHRLLRVTNLEALRALMRRNAQALTGRNYIAVNNVLFCLDHQSRTVTAAERDLGLYWQQREGTPSFARRRNHPEQLAAIAAIIFPTATESTSNTSTQSSSHQHAETATDTDSSDEEFIIDIETIDSDDDQQQAPSPAPSYTTTVVIDWQLAAYIDLSDTTRVPNFTNHMALSTYLQHHPTGLHHHRQIIIEGICYGIDHASRTVTTETTQAAPSHYQSYLQQQLFPPEPQPSFINILTGEAEGATASGLSLEEELEEGLPWNMVDIEAWLAEQPEALDGIPIESLLDLSPAE